MCPKELHRTNRKKAKVTLHMGETKLNIIYEDEAIIVCEKEAGIATQTKKIGQKDMESMLRTYRMQKGEPSYIGVVHRLDQPVRGVMVFAKTKEAAADLSRQVSEKTADKYYYAVVDGVPKKEMDTLVDYLLKDGKTNLSKVVGKDTKDAKRAELSYEVLEKNETQALLKIKLLTGRHHQIRVQMAYAGYPLLGDRKYNPVENETNLSKNSFQQLCLCSYKLSFLHPSTKRKMEFELQNPFQLEKI